MRLQMTTMSDAMRGYLLAPLDGNEARRKSEADAALEETVSTLSANLTALPEMLALVEQIEHFDADTLNQLEDQMMPMVAADRVQAVTFYQTSYLPARMQDFAMVETFSAAATKHRDRILTAGAAERRLPIELVASGALLAIAGAVLLAWRFGKSISRLVNAMTGTLSHLAAHDLACPIPNGDRSDEFGQMARAALTLRDTLASAAEATTRHAAWQAEKLQRANATSSLIQRFETETGVLRRR